MSKFRNLLLAIAFLFTANGANAIGLICNSDTVGPACFITYASGTNLVYRLDQGPLGFFSNTQLDSFTTTELAKWNNLAEASIDFQRDSTANLDFDVDSSNFQPVLDADNALGFSPIVWDDDGSLTEALGASKDSTLGFAGITFTSNGGTNIAESQAVFNGALFTEASSENELRSTILHELAHAVGIDHTQTHLDIFNEVTTANSVPSRPNNAINLVPVMFPIAATTGTDLLLDDEASFAQAYPSAAFNNRFGQIIGELRDSSNNPIRGVTVTAYDVNNPFVNAVSSPSDILAENNGKFILPVPPGTYVLRVQRIDAEFVDGSSIGAFAPNTTAEEGYFNGTGLASTFESAVVDSPKALTTGFNNVASGGMVTVSAGQTTVVNITTGTGNGGGNDDIDEPDGDRFRFSGKAVNNIARLRDAKSKKVKLTLKRNPGFFSDFITLTSDQPNLVSFKPSTFKLKKKKKVKVILESFFDFLEAFPEIEEAPVDINITGTDSNGNTVTAIITVN